MSMNNLLYTWHAGKQAASVSNCAAADPSTDDAANACDGQQLNWMDDCCFKVIGLAILPITAQQLCTLTTPGLCPTQQLTSPVPLTLGAVSAASCISKTDTSGQAHKLDAEGRPCSSLWILPSSDLQRQDQLPGGKGEDTNLELAQGCQTLLQHLLSSAPSMLCFDSQGLCASLL